MSLLAYKLCVWIQYDYIMTIVSPVLIIGNITYVLFYVRLFLVWNLLPFHMNLNFIYFSYCTCTYEQERTVSMLLLINVVTFYKLLLHTIKFGRRKIIVYWQLDTQTYIQLSVNYVHMIYQPNFLVITSISMQYILYVHIAIKLPYRKKIVYSAKLFLRQRNWCHPSFTVMMKQCYAFTLVNEPHFYIQYLYHWNRW